MMNEYTSRYAYGGCYMSQRCVCAKVHTRLQSLTSIIVKYEDFNKSLYLAILMAVYFNFIQIPILMDIIFYH